VIAFSNQHDKYNMENTLHYTERKSVPAAEAKVYALLQSLDQPASAYAICRASGHEVAQTAIYVLASRLVKRGLVVRDEVQVEISPGDYARRVVFRIADAKGVTPKASSAETTT
jgi:hypothetical protein